MLLPSLLKSGDQVYQKVIKQLYQKMLLLNLLITVYYSLLHLAPKRSVLVSVANIHGVYACKSLFVGIASDD